MQISKTYTVCVFTACEQWKSSCREQYHRSEINRRQDYFFLCDSIMKCRSQTGGCHEKSGFSCGFCRHCSYTFGLNASLPRKVRVIQRLIRPNSERFLHNSRNLGRFLRGFVNGRKRIDRNPIKSSRHVRKCLHKFM